MVIGLGVGNEILSESLVKDEGVPAVPDTGHQCVKATASNDRIATILVSDDRVITGVAGDR